MTAIPGTIKSFKFHNIVQHVQRTTFKYRATKIWNALDEQLKSFDCINLFQKYFKSLKS